VGWTTDKKVIAMSSPRLGRLEKEYSVEIGNSDKGEKGHDKTVE
jgi:hypothetical protein